MWLPQGPFVRGPDPLRPPHIVHPFDLSPPVLPSTRDTRYSSHLPEPPSLSKTQTEVFPVRPTRVPLTSSFRPSVSPQVPVPPSRRKVAIPTLCHSFFGPHRPPNVTETRRQDGFEVPPAPKTPLDPLSCVGTLGGHLHLPATRTPGLRRELQCPRFSLSPIPFLSPVSSHRTQSRTEGPSTHLDSPWTVLLPTHPRRHLCYPDRPVSSPLRLDGPLFAEPRLHLPTCRSLGVTVPH